MQHSYTSGANYSGKNTKIGIVSARFNGKIIDAMWSAAAATLIENGVADSDITSIYVPGAFELPLACKAMATSNRHDGVIALGCVIRGDTPHFDYVCQAATTGILQTTLITSVPVAFGVLTTNTVEQAMLRSSSSNPENNKGHDCALCVLEMINVLKSVNP